MRLTSQRQVAAAVAAALVAIALAVVAGGRGCHAVDGAPEDAVRAFVSAARGGDRRAAWELLGPATRQRLEEAAARATDSVGGTRRFAGVEMLEVGGGSGGAWEPKDYDVLEEKGGRARVKVSGAGGAADVLEAVEVEGRWRVELPGGK